MNEHDWKIAFEKYQEIAQYKYIHNYFTLQDFKFIYFWEWLHRNWARFYGHCVHSAVRLFIYKKNRPQHVWPMVILFILGALQGLVGWIMVASGVGNRPGVRKPYTSCRSFYRCAIITGICGMVCIKYQCRSLKIPHPFHKELYMVIADRANGTIRFTVLLWLVHMLQNPPSPGPASMENLFLI